MRTIIHALLLTGCSALCTGSASAQATEPFYFSRELSGGWGGWRPHLNQMGFEFDLAAYERLGTVLAGGKSQSSSEFSFLDAGVRLDLESFQGLAGQDAYLRLALRRGGDGLSDEVGASQRLDRLEGDTGLFISELWYRFTGPHDRVRAYVGKVDAQRVFARTSAVLKFRHGSVGFDSVLLPFFPNTAFGAMVEHFIDDNLSVAGGLFSADQGGLDNPRGGLTAGFEEQIVNIEVAYDWTSLGDAEVGRAGVGYWHHTGDFATRNGSTASGEEGGYLFAEQELWRGVGAAGEAPSMNVFGQFNWNSKDVFSISHQLGLGARLLRYLPTRPLDESGVFFGFAYVRDQPKLERELSMEAYHRFQLLPAVGVAPRVQWIIEPGGTGTDALVLGVDLDFRL